MSADATTPHEVVTHARVRVIDLPQDAGRLALITIDNDRDHTRPSTFGPGFISSMGEALDRVAAMPDLAGVGVTGKPFIFAVGADLSAVGSVSDRDQITPFVKSGHDVLRRFGEMDIPTFAFVNGAAMGGGLELALHCDYRTISSNATAVSFPEVFLGLIPGWGGAYLLPNLIGPADALQVIVANSLQQNKQLKASDALRLHIMDAMFEAADFIEQSLLWAAGIINGTVVVQRPEVDRESWDAVVDIAHGMVDSRLHGSTPAPYKALELVRQAKTATRDEGFAAEDDALTELIMGDDLRASLYAFDLVQRRAKKPVGVPDMSLALPVKKVGIVGAGLMASQLALLFAKRLEVPIVITDLDSERVEKGLAYVRDDIAGQVAKGRLSQDKANRLTALVTGDTSKDAFADADFVIEAVFESLDVKKQVLAEVEAVVSDTCILATNTSSLSITEMAAGLKHPERVVGFHFFNPVALMPLLEIARAESTDDQTLATAFAVGKKLRKSSVLVKDAPAFVVNRLLTRFMGEVTKAVDEGTDFAVADHALDSLGLPMSPFNLLALVGPAVAYHVSESMVAAFPDRFYASTNLAKVVAAGKPSLWVSAADGSQSIDPEVAALFTQGNDQLTAEEVSTRALDAMADEVRRMLDEGVVASPKDIDLCMLLGAGWPFWLGGITPYLDRSGASERVTGKRFLKPGVASVPVV